MSRFAKCSIHGWAALAGPVGGPRHPFPLLVGRGVPGRVQRRTCARGPTPTDARCPSGGGSPNRRSRHTTRHADALDDRTPTRTSRRRGFVVRGGFDVASRPCSVSSTDATVRASGTGSRKSTPPGVTVSTSQPVRRWSERQPGRTVLGSTQRKSLDGLACGTYSFLYSLGGVR